MYPERMTQFDPESVSNDAICRKRIAIVVISLSLVAALLPKFLELFDTYNQYRLRLGIDFLMISHPLLRVFIACIGVVVLRKICAQRDLFTLGVRLPPSHIARGLAIGLGCSIPMLGLGLLGGLQDADYRYMYASTLGAALSEEFVFRAFAFGLLVQLCGVGLWTSALFTGLLFGVCHISFRSAFSEGIVDQLDFFLLLTALGGVLYAWLYHRSQYNLWLVISLHFFMNLWWTIFDLGGTSLGDLGATISRIACVTLAIFLLIHLYPSPATIGDDATLEDN